MKKCPKCGESKPHSSYYKDKSKPLGISSYCKKCSRHKANQWNLENAEQQRHNNLKSRYNITLEDYNNMYELQGGVCAICGLSQSVNRLENLCVDHSHVTGDVRGLLCHHCNAGLGQFKDDPRLLNKASDYLMKHLQP